MADDIVKIAVTSFFSIRLMHVCAYSDGRTTALILPVLERRSSHSSGSSLTVAGGFVLLVIPGDGRWRPGTRLLPPVVASSGWRAWRGGMAGKGLASRRAPSAPGTRPCPRTGSLTTMARADASSASMVHADTRRLRFTGRLPWRCRRHGAERRGLKDPEAEQLHELAVAPSDRRAPCGTTRAGTGERSPSQSQSRKSLATTRGRGWTVFEIASTPIGFF